MTAAHSPPSNPSPPPPSATIPNQTTYVQIENETRALLYSTTEWANELQSLAYQTIQERGGVTDVTMEELASVLMAKGPELISEDTKGMILERIQDLLLEEEVERK